MFIGERAIERIDWTTVYFTSGEQKEYTEDALKYIVTKKPKDATEFRQLIVENVLPEIKALVVWDDIVDIVSKIMLCFEKHDVTNIEIQTLMKNLLADNIQEQNDFIKKKIGKQMDVFQAKIEKIKQVEKLLGDSYEHWLFIALGKIFGTFESWLHPNAFLENIRISDLKKHI